eukprot:TRINITY_DN37199_c0_g1_i1.p1 TRINITY_DN37199_c0_g1~~TRINITY_DN37199_c0_g1_i1.p1  ORF type:complete len:415 (-),score=71.96 TRINITY_DN37199_c0_g1_i1:57-1301(-)
MVGLRADTRHPSRGQNRTRHDAATATRKDGCITYRRGGSGTVWDGLCRSVSAQRRPTRRPGTSAVPPAPGRRRRSPLGEITNLNGLTDGSALEASFDGSFDASFELNDKSSSSAHCRSYQVSTEYHSDILGMMLSREKVFMPSTADFHSWMRIRLHEWLSHVHNKFCMRPQTLLLTVNIADRYCSRVPTGPELLQCVGVAALLIAAKFEEPPSRYNPPKLRELSYISDGSFSDDDIASMECAILANLEFEVAGPTAAHFIFFFLAVSGRDASPVLGGTADIQMGQATAHWSCAEATAYSGSNGVCVHTTAAQSADGQDELRLSWYILELTLIDGISLRYLPSIIALAVWLLAHRLLGRATPWADWLVQVTRVEECAIEGCVTELRGLFEASQQNMHAKAIRNKHRLAVALLQTS